ncbi:major facilitator superfamily domain-containing protein [Bombardia bombarda]|uniref:Major facilitator superfamily domain-containing protein n=1 Tax=Bombardia bombarda TaxID=252184 RepID=A0AA40C1L8_9PEZI|nr:major facilitator superfamily domain-containing protein [Bombardia bombarda]
MIIVALMLSMFLIALDLTIVATAIPSITNEFHGLQDVAWYGAAFFMTAGGFQSTWGKIFRYFPLKRGYLAAIFVFEVGSLLCGVAPNSASFIVGRALAGVGAAGIGTGSFTIVAFIAEPKRRPAYTGMLGAVYGVACVLGPLLGGVFSDTTTWRWCFYINLPIGAITVAVVVFTFHAPASSRPLQASWLEKFLQVDPIGTSLLMGAIVIYLMAVHYGGQLNPWSSSLVIGLLVGTGLVWIAFIGCEIWQGERAVFIPRLFKQREIYLSSFYSITLSGAFFTMIYYLPIYFQAVRGSTPISSGVQNLPFIISAMIGALGAGVFISATGLSTLLMAAGAVIGTIGCGICYTFDTDTSTGKWIGYQLVAGLGLGGAFQIPIILGQVSVDPVDLSAATAILLSFQTIGGALFVSAAQSAFVNTLIKRLPDLAPGVDPMVVVATGAGQLRTVFGPDELPGVVAAYLAGIQVVFILCTALCGAALVGSFFFRWKRLDRNAVKEAGAA